MAFGECASSLFFLNWVFMSSYWITQHKVDKVALATAHPNEGVKCSNLQLMLFLTSFPLRP